MPEATGFDEYLERVNSAVHSLQFAVRSLVYHRAILANDPAPSHFWIHVNTQLLRSYVIYWTNVLGSDSNATHWKNLVQDVPEFREKLLLLAEMERDDLKVEWAAITDLRNKVIAHDDFWDRPDAVPDLEPSLRLVKSLHQLLKEEAIERGKENGQLVKFEVMSIDQWEQNLVEEAGEVVAAARSSTRDLPEFQ